MWKCFAFIPPLQLLLFMIIKLTFFWERALALDSWAKGSDTPSPWWVIVDDRKVKPSVFLLVAVRKGIWPLKLHTLKPTVKLSRGQPANSGLPEKWPFKWDVHVCVNLDFFFWGGGKFEAYATIVADKSSNKFAPTEAYVLYMKSSCVGSISKICHLSVEMLL